MEFVGAAPGRLTVEGGSYFADWAIEPGNVGYTDAEASSVIGSILNDSRSWGAAGITFRESVTPKVTYKFVHGPFDCGGASANGCTHSNVDGTASVTISYERAIAGFTPGLVNHESAHAFFTATHEVGPGGPGVMTGDSPDGWPTSGDVADVVAWLGGTGGGVFWFPGDLEHYITKWPLSGVSELRFFANVVRGTPGAYLRPVWGKTHDDLLEGRFDGLTDVVSVDRRGTYSTGWVAVPPIAKETGDVWIGVRVKRDTADVDVMNLAVGLAQLDAR